MAKGNKKTVILIVISALVVAVISIVIFKRKKIRGSTVASALSSTVTAGYSTENFPLQKGMAGEKVRALQGGLEILGYSVGKWGVDGKFGNDTLTAVRLSFKNPNKTQVTEAEWKPFYDIYSVQLPTV
ncbi:MAG: hypothetical protein LBI45_00590 [Bacteroidales bacterium]|jgi:hypothetical protein|nr:hypothetical protein [Bacteroidales bacterium]